MVEIWALIFMFMGAGRGAATSVEGFQSKALCDYARADIELSVRNSWQNFYTVCVKTGEVPKK